MSDVKEKSIEKVVDVESTSSAPGNGYYDEETELREPPKNETLHRGLKARQISMIGTGQAFCVGVYSPHFAPFQPLAALWELV